MPAINGTTEIYGLIGHPVAHSLSPFIHNFFAEYLGRNTAYAAFSVPPENIENAISGAYSLGIKGLNITTPHKQAVIPFLCGTDEQASRIGAVNTIKYSEDGYLGYNTDISGLELALKKHNIDVCGKRTVILGAGGSAASAAFALANGGASEIIIANRTYSNANKLAEKIKKYYNVPIVCVNLENLSDYGGIELLIQTTSVGFSELKDRSPLSDTKLLKSVRFALDFIYSPYETLFLKTAAAAGCVGINGIDILIYQAAAAYEIWTETKVPFECIDALSEKLKRFVLS